LWHIERTRLELIEALAERERQKEKQERQRQIAQAESAVQSAMQDRQQLVQKIEEAKAALAELIEAHAKDERETKARYAKTEQCAREVIADVIEKHAEAEQRESERNRALRVLLEAEDEPAIVTNGSGQVQHMTYQPSVREETSKLP